MQYLFALVRVALTFVLTPLAGLSMFMIWFARCRSDPDPGK